MRLRLKPGVIHSQKFRVTCLILHDLWLVDGSSRLAPSHLHRWWSITYLRPWTRGSPKLTYNFVRTWEVAIFVIPMQYRPVIPAHILIVWQRFCEPSPDLGFRTVRVCIICVWVVKKPRDAHPRIKIGGVPPWVPDTADCKPVHYF